MLYKLKIMLTFCLLSANTPDIKFLTSRLINTILKLPTD